MLPHWMFHTRVLSDSEVNASSRPTFYMYFLVYPINHLAKEQAANIFKVWDLNLTHGRLKQGGH